jgi:hypothetical protein
MILETRNDSNRRCGIGYCGGVQVSDFGLAGDEWQDGKVDVHWKAPRYFWVDGNKSKEVPKNTGDVFESGEGPRPRRWGHILVLLLQF